MGKTDEFADVEIIEGKNQIVVHEMGKTVQILLHERLFQFEHPISIDVKGSQISLKPSIRPRIQEQSLRLRSDPTQIYSALLEIDCSQTCSVTERVDYHPDIVEQ
ncbi:MAG: hypothetical protein VX278_12440 [Myxococcota bacterium]|nr:hypothetical protein [Myxococcota bacterium]